MNGNREALSQIGITLANHFDSVYYVDVKTGNYHEYVHMEFIDKLGFPESGEDFFSDCLSNAAKWIHPNDLQLAMHVFEKKILLDKLSYDKTFSMICREIINGNTEHVRHIFIMCKDNEHILCCLERIEEEIRTKKEQERVFQSAKRMARLDELTGVRNKNAYMEYAVSINKKLKSEPNSESFAVVMCDVNDLKLMNDTRGHSFGDEAIQRASRMVCSVFEHSPVFRVGGDEFVAVLFDRDYEERENLFRRLKEESLTNKRSRSGPIVACGMAEYDPKKDKKVEDVYERADEQMYIVKKELKSIHLIDGFANMERIDASITDERKRLLDGMFEALYTIAGEGYVFICDMRYDFSRWSISLVVDFDLESEYMYHADRIWQNYIHPEDLDVYRKAVDTAICGNAQVTPIYYRARLADGKYVMLTTRAFILSDSNGNPDYFGGIIIPQ